MGYLGQKYYQITSVLLLCGYLITSFSVPTLEVVHFLLHLGDDLPNHTFVSHKENHTHNVLEVFNKVTDSNEDELPLEIPNLTLLKKNFPIYSVSYNLVELPPLTIEPTKFGQLDLPYLQPYLSNWFPPPDAS